MNPPQGVNVIVLDPSMVQYVQGGQQTMCCPPGHTLVPVAAMVPPPPQQQQQPMPYMPMYYPQTPIPQPQPQPYFAYAAAQPPLQPQPMYAIPQPPPPQQQQMFIAVPNNAIGGKQFQKRQQQTQTLPRKQQQQRSASPYTRPLAPGGGPMWRRQRVLIPAPRQKLHPQQPQSQSQPQGQEKGVKVLPWIAPTNDGSRKYPPDSVTVRIQGIGEHETRDEIANRFPEMFDDILGCRPFSRRGIAYVVFRDLASATTGMNAARKRFPELSLSLHNVSNPMTTAATAARSSSLSSQSTASRQHSSTAAAQKPTEETEDGDDAEGDGDGDGDHENEGGEDEDGVGGEDEI